MTRYGKLTETGQNITSKSNAPNSQLQMNQKTTYGKKKTESIERDK